MVKKPLKSKSRLPAASRVLPSAQKPSQPLRGSPVRSEGFSPSRDKGFPPAPSGFHAVEKELWDTFVRENVFDSRAGLSLLESALRAHERARECREAIARDGLSFRDSKSGSIKSHPLLATERDARSSYVLHLRALKLEVF
jgi:hypothetical protein